MADGQKAKAKGKKIGRFSRKPTNVRYKAENRHDKNHIRRMERADKDYDRNFALRVKIAIDKGEAKPKYIERAKRYPGWTYREGYGYVRA